MAAYYPGAEFPTSEAWVDDVTPLDAEHLNMRDDEIRAIEHALGTDLVPDTNTQLGTYARAVRITTPASSHLNLGGNGHDVVVGNYGTASAPAGQLHVYGGSASGVVPNVNADNVVIEDNGNAGLSILFPLSSTGRLLFGSADGSTQLEDRGRVQYAGATKEMRLGSNESGGKVILASGANTTGITLDANQDATFAGDVSASGDLTVDGNLTIGATTAVTRPLMNKEATTAGAYFENTGDTAVSCYFDADRGASGNMLARFYGRWAGNNVASMGFVAGSDTTNKDEGEIAFYTTSGSSNLVERLRIQHDGTVDIGGDLVLGASTPINRPLMNKETTTAGAYFENTGDTAVACYFDADRGASDAMLARFYGRWAGNNVASMGFLTGDDTTNQDDGEIAFYTSASGSNPLERVRIRRDGAVGFTGAVAVAGDTALGGDASITGNASIGGDATVSGDSTVSGDVIVGAATATNRPLMIGATSDAGAYFQNSGDSAVIMYLDADRGAAGQAISRLYGRWSNNNVAQIAFMTGADTVNKDDGEIAFLTSDSAANPVERMRIRQDGAVDIGGDVILGGSTPIGRSVMNKSVTDAGAYFENTGAGATRVFLDADRTGSGEYLGRLHGRWNNNDVAEIAFVTGSDATSKDDGEIAFYTSAGGSNPAERMRVRQDGTVDFAKSILLSEQSTTPANPAQDSEARMYVRGDKLIVQFNDGGTVRYKSMLLSGTGATWVQSETPPT